MNILYPIRKDLTGSSFGRLKVLSLAPRKYGKNSFWSCVCNCGNQVIINSSDLKKGNTSSCGCLRKEGVHAYSHGLSRSTFYKRWKRMNERCYQKSNASYPRYGAKGIKIEWTSFEEFRDDMYVSFLEHVKTFGVRNTTIDRIDGTLGYSKRNCRWATYKEQALNRTKNVISSK